MPDRDLIDLHNTRYMAKGGYKVLDRIFSDTKLSYDEKIDKAKEVFNPISRGQVVRWHIKWNAGRRVDGVKS